MDQSSFELLRIAVRDAGAVAVRSAVEVVTVCAKVSLGMQSYWPHIIAVLVVTGAISVLLSGGRSWIARLDGERIFDLSEAKRRQDAVVMGVTFAILSVIGLFVTAEAVLFCCSQDCRVFTVLLWAFAAVAFGMFLGFLFGVPKSGGTEDDGGEGGPKRRRGSRTNTSLEQISDWLTKIIVGVSLVEAKQLFGMFKKAVEWFARGLETMPNATGQTLAAAVLVFFAVIGFLSSYLITRTYLAEVLQGADKAINDVFDATGTSPEASDAARGTLRASEADKMRADQQKIGSVPSKNISFSEPALKLAEKFKTVGFETLKTWQEFAAWGLAQLADGKPNEALRGYERAVGLNPDDAGLLYEYVAVLDQVDKEQMDRNKAKLLAIDTLRNAVAKVSKAPDSKLRPEECKLRADIYNSLTFRLLYVGTDDALRDAIRYADEFIGFAGTDMQGPVLVNRICALGQLAQSLSKSQPGFKDTAEYQDLRRRALEDTKMAISLDTGWRARLRFLLDPMHPDKVKYPDKFQNENDLEVFAADAEFAEVVGARVQQAQ